VRATHRAGRRLQIARTGAGDQDVELPEPLPGAGRGVRSDLSSDEGQLD
jgi:hypothetical protein